MNIGIDVRPLLDPIKSGVPEYIRNLLENIFKTDNPPNPPPYVRGSKEGLNQYFLFYNVWDKNLEKNLPEFDYPNVQWYASHYPNKIFNFSGRLFGFPKFDKIIEKHFKVKLDLFICFNYELISLSPDLKKIVVAHDLSFVINLAWSSFKRRFKQCKLMSPEKFFKEADSVVAVSENTKRDLLDIFKITEKKITVIYPGVSVPPSVTPAEAGVQKFNLPQKFILCLGTIEPRKNVLGIVKAFEIWQEKSALAKDFYLVLAGFKGWSSSAVWRAIGRSPYKEKIKYLGAVSEEDKFSLYRLAKLFLSPSFYEGFGFPPLEAMTNGIPVIASANSSFPEVLGDAAYLVNPYDINDMASGIEAVLSNDKIREQFVQKGLEQVKKFNWQKSAEEWVNLVNGFKIDRVPGTRRLPP